MRKFIDYTVKSFGWYFNCLTVMFLLLVIVAEVSYKIGGWNLIDNQWVYVIYAPFIVCSSVFFPMLLWAMINAALLLLLQRYCHRFTAPFDCSTKGRVTFLNDPGIAMCLSTFVPFFIVTILLIFLGIEPVSMLIRALSGH